jgi:tRNA(fMet)-specific endonuclease VapC
MYLLDTNILTYFFKQQGGVAQRMYAHPPALLHVPSVAILEIEFGIGASSKPEKHRPQLDWVLRTFHIAHLDADAAQAAGHIRHVLQKSGTPIGTYDLLIAGIALANRYIVVTRNTREFERVAGLKVENWFDENLA